MFSLALGISACSTDEGYLAQDPQPVLWVPANFPDLPESRDNPLTAEGIKLGKKLFFDVRLSGDNSISCATCHQPELAFSEGSALSTKGISGKTLLRHVPALINLAWAENGLFWDGGSLNLESQAFAPLAHEDEMFQDLNELEQELAEVPEYIALFQDAFDQKVKANLAMQALAQYQRSLVFANSTYDKYVRNENDIKLTLSEQKGLDVFQNKCSQCHKSDLFTDNEYHNNGLDALFDDHSEEDLYLGRYRVTRALGDVGKYRTPTLRNLVMTAPYMHDGRFGNLQSVLDFYANGVQDSETLDPILKQNGKLGIDLSTEDKEALIAFLNTLTDDTYSNDERFAEY